MRIEKIKPQQVHIHRDINEVTSRKLNDMRKSLELLAEDYGYDMRFVEYNKALLVNFGPRTGVINTASNDLRTSVYEFINKKNL